MAQLQQIQVKFSAVEDRFLLRVYSDDDLEYLLLDDPSFRQPHLTDNPDVTGVDADDKNADTATSEKRGVGVWAPKAVSNLDFKTPNIETAKNLPLGEQPVLPAKSQMRRKADGLMVMALAPENGIGIDLTFNIDLLHSLAKLISNSVRIAKWDLQTPIKSPTTESAWKVTIN